MYFYAHIYEKRELDAISMTEVVRYLESRNSKQFTLHARTIILLLLS